jgi:hypothetical protein
MAFYIGDVPAQPFVIEPPESITLADFDTAVAGLVTPSGTLTSDPVANIIDDVIEVTFPDDATLFDEAGIFRLTIRLTGVGAATLPPIPLVAQPLAYAWHTLDSIRAEWPDAEAIGDATLWEMLEVVKEQVLTFAPALAEGTPVPANYRLGQRVQVRNLWNATKVAPDGTVGSDDFVIRPFPLDWHVKAILRPKRGIPVIG